MLPLFRFRQLSFREGAARPEQNPVRHAPQDRDLARGQGTGDHEPPPFTKRTVAVPRVVEVDGLERPVPVPDGRLDLGGGRELFGLFAGPASRRRGGERRGDGQDDRDGV